MSAVEAPPAPGQGPDPSVLAPPADVDEAEIPGPATDTGRRALAIDALGLGALCMIAVSGYSTAFGGTRHLIVGATATVLGIALAVLLRKRSLWLLVGSLVLTEVLVGALLVRPDAVVAPVLPTPTVARDMVTGAFQGWVNLLTTTVPVGGAQNLLVVPWAATLVGAASAMSISTRADDRPWALLALLAPTALFVGGLLVGTDTPAWGLQASAFVTVAVLWGSSRQRRSRGAGISRGRGPRWASGVGLLAVALVAGLVVGRSDVFGGRERFVLRDHVEPPVDLRQLPSPLDGFRGYRTDDRRDDVLFTFEGLEDGDRIRLATLDHYDGRVWHVQAGPADDSSSGYFRRVGQRIPTDVDGEQRSIEVEVGDYRGVWLPTVGVATGVVFRGDRATELSEGLRFNVATATAALPDAVGPGDRYRLDAVVADEHRDLEDGHADPTVTVPETTVGPELRLRAAQLGGQPGDTPLARARAIERWFQSADEVEDDTDRAYFSDGYQDERPDAPASFPGHSSERLREMLDDSGFVVGNEEQFASAMALMARALGLPSRVVMGFSPTIEDGTATVTAESVDAWAEVAIDGVGWIPLDPTPVDRDVPNQESLRPQPPPDVYVPPPPVTVPRVDVPSGAGAGAECEDCDASEGSDDGLPAWVGTVAKVVGPPIVLVGGGTALLAGIKAWRRRRRRRRGTAATRVHAAWIDVCDLARDMGEVVPDRATRREVAVVLGLPGVGAFARSTDALVFGPAEVDDSTAARFWKEADTLRSSMTGSLSVFGRWKALVNPTSLRRRGRRRGSASVPPAT